MSYILDALKKAEAERKLGSIPDLNAQSVASMSPDDKPAFWRRPLAWIMLTMLVSVPGTFIWFKSWQQTAPAVVVTAQLPEQPMPKPAETVTQPVSAPPVVQAPVVAARPADAPAPVKALPAEPAKRKSPVKEAVKVKEVATAKKYKPPQPAPVPEAPSDKKPQPMPAAAPLAEKLPTLRELPENIQRDIPPLAIGGYIYSSNQAERSILINNRLLREGEQAAPGLTLEKMMPREAILSFRGYRYRITY